MMNNNEYRFPIDRYFYDTSSLLIAGEDIFKQDHMFYISSITLKELENIKTSSHKDDNIKYAARLLLHLFEKYPDKYDVIIHKTKYEKKVMSAGFLDINDDLRILSDAIVSNAHDNIVFITNDLNLKQIANCFFGHGMIDSVPETKDEYLGYKEVVLDEKELATFYEDPKYNYFNSLTNEYVIIKSEDNKVVDLRVWDGSGYNPLAAKPINTKFFGKISPYNGDIYQKMLIDSLKHNKITMVKGAAGTGKSYISLGYLMSKLENGTLDKIIVFCNTIATANSAKLGFYPGTRLEKLMDSQIGNLLASKLGGKDTVQQFIDEGKLEILPFSDIRGYDTTGMNAGIYISEAQNLDRTLMKLALQRVGEDCICIIDGDDRTQVDDVHFSGANNGMKRVSEVFKGHDIYGEVTLKNVYRSKIASIAEDI